MRAGWRRARVNQCAAATRKGVAADELDASTLGRPTRSFHLGAPRLFRSRPARTLAGWLRSRPLSAVELPHFDCLFHFNGPSPNTRKRQAPDQARPPSATSAFFIKDAPKPCSTAGSKKAGLFLSRMK